MQKKKTYNYSLVSAETWCHCSWQYRCPVSEILRKPFVAKVLRRVWQTYIFHSLIVLSRNKIIAVQRVCRKKIVRFYTTYVRTQRRAIHLNTTVRLKFSRRYRIINVVFVRLSEFSDHFLSRKLGSYQLAVRFTLVSSNGFLGRTLAIPPSCTRTRNFLLTVEKPTFRHRPSSFRFARPAGTYDRPRKKYIRAPVVRRRGERDFLGILLQRK